MKYRAVGLPGVTPVGSGTVESGAGRLARVRRDQGVPYVRRPFPVIENRTFPKCWGVFVGLVNG
jgi:hypothetical protein